MDILNHGRDYGIFVVPPPESKAHSAAHEPRLNLAAHP
jgi:hypothetical protein